MEYLFTDIVKDVTKTAVKIPQNKYLEKGEYPIFDQGKEYIGGFSNDAAGVVTDIPYIIFGDHTRSIKYVESPCFIGADGVKLLKVSEKEFLPKYVYYSMIANPVESKGYARHYKLLKETKILGASFEIQKQVISSLDEIVNLIETKNRELSTLGEIVKSRFIEMFGDIEDKISLKEICNISGGYSFKSSDVCDSGIKLLQIGNVALNDLDWTNANCLPLGFDTQKPNFLLKENDIVVALTRPIIQSLGNVKACIVKKEDLPCLLNQRVGKIQCIEGKSDVRFVFGCLMTDTFTEHVQSCCTGCSQPNISTKDLESYLIPNVDTKQQIEFSKFKEQIDKSRSIIQKQIKELQELFDSKMDEYFAIE